jgi:hypothetical protein
MPRKRSLQAGIATRMPIHAQLLDGRVVDVRLAADQEHHVFLVGRFERLAHPHGGRRARGHFDQVDSAETLGLGVAAEGMQGCLPGHGEEGLIALDAANAARGEDVLVVADGVEDQEDVPVLVGRQLDCDALDHWIPRSAMVVCEGAATARALGAAGVLPRGSIVLEVRHGA